MTPTDWLVAYAFGSFTGMVFLFCMAENGPVDTPKGVVTVGFLINVGIFGLLTLLAAPWLIAIVVLIFSFSYLGTLLHKIGSIQLWRSK